MKHEQSIPEKRRFPLKKLILVLAAALLTELALSNFYALYSLLFQGDCVYFEASLSPSPEMENITEQGEFVVDAAHPSLNFGALPSPLRSVSFRVRYRERPESNSLSYVDVGGADENTTDAYILYQRTPIRAGLREAEDNCIRLSTHGKSSSLELYFQTEEELLIRDVRFNERESFSFHPLRFLLIAGLGGLVLLGKRLSKQRLCFSSASGKALLTGLMLFSLLMSVGVGVFLMGENSFSTHSYPLVAAEERYNPYVQQFDAFHKGQLHLDLSVSEELAALPNPYDFSARESVDYHWDRAFFEGKYYSYFGIAPLLTVYEPFYILTGSLPGEGIVMTLFSAAAGIFTVLSLWEIAKLTKKKLSALHFALGTLATLFASLLWQMQRGMDHFYYIATLSAMAFTAMLLFFCLKGFFHPGKLKRRLYLAAAGLCFSLVLLSRVNCAILPAVAVAVFALFHVLRGENKLSRLLDLLAPALLVLAALSFALWFNAARFGNPFEFGARYQLTVSDTSYNRMGADNLFPALYHYFLEPLSLSDAFPFVGYSSRLLDGYGHYVYVAETNAGLFSMPLMLSLFAFGALWKKKALPKEYRVICLSLLCALPVMAFLNYSMGGVILRYVADLAPCGAMLSTCVLWELCDNASGEAKCSSEKGMLSLCKGIFVLSILLGALLLLIHGSADFAAYSPDLFLSLRSVFTL